MLLNTYKQKATVNKPALGIAVASFFEAREKDTTESPTAPERGNAQIKKNPFTN